MAAAGDILPSGHRLARRLAVLGGGWFVTHPGLPGRTWLLRERTRLAPPPHPLAARPVDVVAYQDAEAELYLLDEGRLVSDGPWPWTIEKARRFLRDLSAALKRGGTSDGVWLAPERVLWYRPTHRVEVLPGWAGEGAPPSLSDAIRGLAGPLLPTECVREYELLHKLAAEGEQVLDAVDTRTRVYPALRVAGFSLTGPSRKTNQDVVGWRTWADGTTAVAVADGLGGTRSGSGSRRRWSTRCSVRGAAWTTPSPRRSARSRRW